MGVPKFYRWLSERYPCLSQVVRDHQIPEFDNLYLDMNGIIHPCSHPNDDDPHFRITEDKIFSNIFHYIEVLFRIIKPQKVFFMAVDGVAPRAKMNQQRARRFRSAREAEENIRKALRKGEVLPTEERFDSNCITPGTEFMVRLHEQLKYFVNKKITTDPGWKGIKIYLSGHETPGEGEHKIMDFIRYERSQSDYDPNTRHCLYGLDADLIMLGLTSHDPHFSLLREEVRFGRNVKRVNNPEDITFHLLHLSLLREYIDLEFQSLEEKISFGYDLEKIIDDWILMGFLVGNDFIPNLPNLHINHDALPYLWKVYKDVMPGLDGYLHDGGFLSLPRFETYLKALSKFDLEKFEDAYTDMKWLEGKLGTPAEKNPLQILFDDSAVESSSEESDKMSLGSPKKDSKLRDYLEEKGVLKEAEAEDDGDFTAEHQKYKQRYYVEKFELTESDSAKDLVDDLCFKYVEAIQWILHYYFNGVPSWGWYYPYHYAPYVSDIQDFQDRPFSFDIGKPFLPFEQLLAVLPAASKKLLPEQFQNLMIMEQSPIIDYYPLEFKTDLNGKRQDWEAVVLIPFINEHDQIVGLATPCMNCEGKTHPLYWQNVYTRHPHAGPQAKNWVINIKERLLQAMEPLYPRLKECERKRNRHSPCSLYTYDKDKSEFYSSSLPGIFPDLECCHARLEVIPIDKYRLSSDEIIKGLLPGVKLDIYFPGFPTLKHIPHSGELKNVRVKVFKMHSRDKSMVLKIDESDEPDIKEIADSMLSKPCFVGWPHLVEAFVTSVSDGSKKFLIAKDSPEKTQEVILSASDVSAWKKQSSCEKQFYLEKKAVDVGMIHVLVEACPIHGKKYICGPKGTVQLEKQWSDWAVTFPLQVTVKNVDAFDETDAGPVCATITDLFPVDTECFMMAIPHYGSSGKVIEVDAKQNRIRVQLTVVPEPDLLSIILNQNDYADVYMPAHVMAKRLGLPFHVLAQITGKVFVTKGDGEGSSKVDIGLNLKYSKQDKEVLGYARRFGGNWNYSPKTERAVSMYQEKYPEVFEALSGSTQFEVLKVSDVFPHAEESEILKEVESWLKTLPSHNQPAVQCGSSTLDEPVVKQIEKAVENLKGEKQNKKNVKVRVKPTVLYRPMKHMGQVAPDPTADFELFDRVVNVRTLGVAPYGLKGTIVGIHQGKSEHDEKTEKKYEVLFDEPFMGGQSLRGLFENKLFVVKAWSLLNLTYGKRLESKKKGISSPLERPRDSGRHLDGAPAGYQPNFRGGSYYKTSEFNAWRSPLNLTSPDGVTPAKQSPNHRFQTPRQEFPSPRERYQTPGHSFSSPRDRFSSPRDLFSRPRDPLSSPEERFPHNGSSSPRTNSSSHHRPQFLQQRESTRQETSFRPRLLLKPQTSPHAANRQYSSLESPDSRNTNDSSAALSAKESERMIRQLLHMDEPSGPSPNMTSPQTIFSNSGPGLPVPPMSPTSPGSVSAPSATLVLVCQQNGLPLPTFAHRRIHQSVVTTVCVAGKLFSGAPCSNIVESTESAALTALANSAVYPNMVNGALPSFPDLSAFASPTSFPNPGFLTPVFAPSSFTPPFRTPPSFPSDFPGTQSPVAASQKDSKLPEKTDKRIPRENSPKTPPVTSNVDKNADSSSETSTGNEPKLDSVGAQRKEIFIPHQVALNSRDAPSMEKITKEKTEPIKKTSPTDAKQSLPTTSNLETTPKVSKGKPGKAKPKLLAPSFFATTAPKN